MKAAKGFTLLEGIIVLSVVTLLAAAAYPAYLKYTRRAYFTENIMKVVEPYKTSVAECYKNKKKLSVCNAGSNKIPAAIKTNTNGVASLSVTNGVISVTPIMQNGINTTDKYILTPSISKNAVVWASSGGAVKNSYAR